MPEIPGQRFSVNEGSMQQLIASIETSIQHINIVFEQLEEGDDKLAAELSGDTLSHFENTAEYIENHIKSVKQKLTFTNQQVQHFTNQYMQINASAEQLANFRR